MGRVDGDDTNTTLSQDQAIAVERSPIISSFQQPVPDVRPGDCLGRYTVRTFLGGGGMGQVFSAWDSELGRTVALKLMRPDRSGSSPSARSRLLREAQALARLHHPNVVTVFDIGTDGDRVFIAM